MRKTAPAVSAFSAMLVPALALAAPLPLAAQSADEPVMEDEQPIAEMTDKLADPEHQQEMAMMMRAMGEVLLDMPVAPMMNAMRDIAGGYARGRAQYHAAFHGPRSGPRA